MSSNNTKKVNNNIEKISTISKNFDELHQIYKDIFNSGELGILESDKDNIYYLDSHNQKKSIEKKFFDLHFSKGIQGNFNRIEESIKNPNLEGRLSDDASFIFLNIFTSGVLGKTCVDRYLSEFTSNLHSFFKENPNSDAKLNLATYISAYSDTQPSINRIKNTTEYFLKHNFIKTSQIASSNYFKHYSVKELIELSDNGLIPKEKIISYCGEQQYSRSVLEAKSKLMIQTHSKEKNKANVHHAQRELKKLMSLPNSFPILADLYTNGVLETNDFKDINISKSSIESLPENLLVHILNTDLAKYLNISSKELINLYGKTLSGDKCIYLAQNKIITPEDLINTINMKSVPIVSPEFAIDPQALLNFYEPNILFDMYQKGNLTKDFTDTFSNKLLATLSKEEKENFEKELVRKTTELDKTTSTETLFNYFKSGILSNNSLSLFMDSDKVVDMFVEDKLEPNDLINLYNSGIITQNDLFDYFSIDEIIKNVSNGTFDEKALLAIPENQREQILITAFKENKLSDEHFMQMFLEHNSISIDKLDTTLKDKKIENIADYINENTNPDRIKDLFLTYHISYEDLNILRSNNLLSDVNFKAFTSAIDKNKFYNDLKHSKLILHSVTTDEHYTNTGKYYSRNFGNLENSSKVTKSKTNFKLEKEGLQLLLDTPNLENSSEVPYISSTNQDGKPTSLDGYHCIPIYKYGLVIFEKFEPSNSLFIMPYQQADYFLHGNMNMLDSSVDINSKNKKTLSQMSSVIVRQHTKHFFRNVLDSVIQLNPEAKNDLKPNGKYSPDAMFFINEMEKSYSENTKQYE